MRATRSKENNKARTDKDGKVSFTIPKIKSKKSTEYFEAKIDVATLLQDATNDFIIKKLLKNFVIEPATIETSVLNPVFFIESSTKSFGNPTSNGLKELCKEVLVANACDFSSNMAEADFILTIVTDCRKTEEVNGICKVNFTAEVTVQNQLGKPLYQRNVTDIMTTQGSCEAAGKEADTKGKEYLKTRVIPDILSQLF